MNRSWMISFVLCMIAIMPICQGQNKFFTGVINDSWTDGGNWNPIGVPGISDDVEIGNLNTARLTGASPTIKSLKIIARGKLIVDDPNTILTVQGALAIGVHVLTRGSLEVLQGTLNIINPGSEGIYIEDDQTSIINHGVIAVQQPGTIGLFAKENIVIENHGVLFINQFMPQSQSFCLQATGGDITNSATGNLLISFCQSTMVVPFQIATGVQFTDLGELSISPSLCLP